MKRAAIVFYTDRGENTARRIAQALEREYEIECFRAKCKLNELFYQTDALIFVGACGIAVRAIAPYLRDKTTDPAVVVVDELGLHAVSLLSGHIGGANALARKIATQIGAAPVITTATDINHRFAVDEWAAKHGLVISSMKAARTFAGNILKRDLPMQCDFPIVGKLPDGLYAADMAQDGVTISVHMQDESQGALYLTPKILYVGIGCKRDTNAATIESAFAEMLQAERMDPRAFCAAASIDVKQNEAGLHSFCQSRALPVRFYSAQELQGVAGDFSASAFVRETVGVDNVCERAAMLSAGENAKLIVKKRCKNGVTIAVAQEDWSVCFE